MHEEKEEFSMESELRNHFRGLGYTDPDAIRKLTKNAIATIEAENQQIINSDHEDL